MKQLSLTEKEFVSARARMYRIRPWSFAVLLSAAIAYFFSQGLYTSHPRELEVIVGAEMLMRGLTFPTISYLAPATIFLLWVVFFYLFFRISGFQRKFINKRIYRDDPFLRVEHNIHWDASGYYVESQFQKMTLPWVLVRYLTEDKNFFLIYTSRHVACILPKRVFESAAELADFRRYIASCERI